MNLKPLPPFQTPLAGGLPATDIWQRYFSSLDQTIRASSSMPGPVASVNNAAGQTLTPAQLLAGVLLRSGPAGAFSDTTPTAASIVAYIPQAGINDNRMIFIGNAAGGAMTILAGTGVTLQGNTSIAAGNGRFFLITITAKAAGVEAVSMRGLITGAM